MRAPLGSAPQWIGAGPTERRGTGGGAGRTPARGRRRDPACPGDPPGPATANAARALPVNAALGYPAPGLRVRGVYHPPRLPDTGMVTACRNHPRAMWPDGPILPTRGRLLRGARARNSVARWPGFGDSDIRAGSYNAPGTEGARLLAEGLRHVTGLTILELWWGSSPPAPPHKTLSVSQASTARGLPGPFRSCGENCTLALLISPLPPLPQPLPIRGRTRHASQQSMPYPNLRQPEAGRLPLPRGCRAALALRARAAIVSRALSGHARSRPSWAVRHMIAGAQRPRSANHQGGA